MCILKNPSSAVEEVPEKPKCQCIGGNESTSNIKKRLDYCSRNCDGSSEAEFHVTNPGDPNTYLLMCGKCIKHTYKCIIRKL